LHISATGKTGLPQPVKYNLMPGQKVPNNLQRRVETYVTCGGTFNYDVIIKFT